MLGKREQPPGERIANGPAEQVASVQQLANVRQRVAQMALVDVREKPHRLARQRPVEHSRPQFHRPIKPRLLEIVGG